jgi:hypothetical protein
MYTDLDFDFPCTVSGCQKISTQETKMRILAQNSPPPKDLGLSTISDNKWLLLIWPNLAEIALT